MNKIHKITTIFLLTILVLTTACKRYTPGKDVISRKKYINVMVDVFLAESIYENHKYTEKDKKFSSDELYLAVLEKHQITEQNIIATTLFYSQQPKLYDDILNDVTNILKTMNVEITEISEQGNLKITPDAKP